MAGEEERVRELERMISELPRGYISVKNVNGKQRHYLQWREGSKIRSKYIRKDEVEKTVEAIEQRRRFEAMLSELSEGEGIVRTPEFDTNVIIGGSLNDMSHRAEGSSVIPTAGFASSTDCAGRGKPPCCASSCSTCLPKNCPELHT